MINGLSKILAEMAKMYEETLRYMFPTEHCNKEANLTTYFYKAISAVCSPLKRAVSYDELPVPTKFRPGKTGDANKDAIDSVLYSPDKNELLLLEAKEKMNPWNSITWDILRADNVVNSVEVFPKKLKNLYGEPIGAGYNATTAFGLILCGYWTYSALDEAKNEIIEGLRGADDPSLGSHQIDENDVLIKEVKIYDKKQIKQGWHYYISIYFWRIYKDSFEESEFDSISQANDEESKLSILARMILPLIGLPKPRTLRKYLYITPQCLFEAMKAHSVSENDFCIWIPLSETKINALCGLSFREKNASLDMPDGWVNDNDHAYDSGSYRNNYVYELGKWSDLDTEEGLAKVLDRINSLVETLPAIRFI